MGTLSSPTSVKAALLRWIIAQHIPFNALNCQEFRDVWRLGKLPGLPLRRKDAAGPGLDSLFEECRTVISRKMATCDHLAIATDGWSGLRTSFWSIAVIIDRSFSLHQAHLGCFQFGQRSNHQKYLQRRFVMHSLLLN